MGVSYRILVAIDLKPGTDRLLVEAQRYAQAFDAVVDIIHVAEPDPTFVLYTKTNVADPLRESQAHELRTEHQRTQDFGAALRAGGVRVDQALTVQGPVLDMIVERVGKSCPDLLILGSHHHGALYRFWYGDISKDAVGQMPCALLVVPA